MKIRELKVNFATVALIRCFLAVYFIVYLYFLSRGSFFFFFFFFYIQRDFDNFAPILAPADSTEAWPWLTARPCRF